MLKNVTTLILFLSAIVLNSLRITEYKNGEEIFIEAYNLQQVGVICLNLLSSTHLKKKKPKPKAIDYIISIYSIHTQKKKNQLTNLYYYRHVGPPQTFTISLRVVSKSVLNKNKIQHTKSNSDSEVWDQQNRPAPPQHVPR